MFRKNKKQTENVKEPREKKVRTFRVGTHKKPVTVSWAVPIVGMSFGAYRNLTAIDMYMIYKIETI